MKRWISGPDRLLLVVLRPVKRQLERVLFERWLYLSEEKRAELAKRFKIPVSWFNRVYEALIDHLRQEWEKWWSGE